MKCGSSGENIGHHEPSHVFRSSQENFAHYVLNGRAFDADVLQKSKKTQSLLTRRVGLSRALNGPSAADGLGSRVKAKG